MSDREYELYVEKKHARAEGLEEGRAEGRAEGSKETRSEERRKTAVDMLAEGEPIEKVVKYSRLSEDEVFAIKASLEH